MTSSLLELAETFARRIPGTRKGSDKPAYLHSLDVAERLRVQGFSEEVCVAGLLHDVLEDSPTTVTELEEAGFSPRILELVRHCSHDSRVEGNDQRWVVMVADLVKANDVEAWAIKLADLTSNVTDCHTMKPERQAFMLNVKVPLLLALTPDFSKLDNLRRTLVTSVAAKNL
jgi:(p)ppGpp synthase/HD superfamily hydrolase